jgi:hypothetical protein
MAYHNLTMQERMLMAAPWYDAIDLMEELTALRKINFAIVEQRAQALERLNSMVNYKPFALNARFENDRLFVCELLGDWPRKFQQLKSALSHKDRDLRSHGVEKSADAPYATFSDSQQAFWNSTTSMLDELLRGENVYDRLKFETKFHLDWH